MKLYELQLDNSKNHSPFVLKVLAVIDKLYAKKKLPMEPGDKDALTQSLLSAMKKRGETVDVVVDAAVKVIDKRMHSTKTSQQAGRYTDLSRVRDAVQQAFKHALTETQEFDLIYKGYSVNFDQDSDGFFWINYNPHLPKEVDLKYNKGLNRTNAEIVAKRAIDSLKNKVSESAPPKKAKVEFTNLKDWSNKVKIKGADVKIIVHRNKNGKRHEAFLNGKLVGWFEEKTKMGIVK